MTSNKVLQLGAAVLIAASGALVSAQTQLLPDPDHIGIVDRVPFGQLLVIETVVERDRVQRVATPDGIELGAPVGLGGRAYHRLRRRLRGRRLRQAFGHRGLPGNAPAPGQCTGQHHPCEQTARIHGLCRQIIRGHAAVTTRRGAMERTSPRPARFRGIPAQCVR